MGAAQVGRDFLLKIGDGESPTNFTTIGGFRAKSISGSATLVDVTNQDSSGDREILDAGGTVSWAASGSGVFTDKANTQTVRTRFETRALEEFQVVVPGMGTFEGYWKITEFEMAGDHDAEVTVSIQLESHGNIAFTSE